tara:strand:- start:341 stop:1099 length:759 start_codon:yes stop_codon:yes gene_type:complete
MNYRNFLLVVIFLLFSNCTAGGLSIDKPNVIFKNGFSNKGFALIYDQKYFYNGSVTKEIDDRSLVILQRNLTFNTQVKVTNILNDKSLIAKVGKSASYPLFNNSVVSKRVANELDINLDEPYIEIIEITENSLFIAKKAKTYEEEKNVATKAPVKNISINDLNKKVTIKKETFNKKFSYSIKIADFYFKDTAKMMLKRIINETEIKNPKIDRIAIDKYRVYLGPYYNINSLQKSYNGINILGFENIEIIKND